MKTPATMAPEEPKASKTPVGVIMAEYKLLCAMFVNGPKPEYDIPRLTKYLGSKSEPYTKGRIQRLLKKNQQDAKDFDEERRLNTVEAIKDAAAAQVRGSKANPRKHAHEDNEYTNDNGNANKRHNLVTNRYKHRSIIAGIEQ
ncbi:hypothetical protein B0T09DRAFT_390930 [Sordaria sp. MPI-SDFR-AT-0083]|nr:hypothetical protein B0T09DRAFT_390930 [Sordaria sp. MPI-SDFR-AT-0083]